MGHIFLHVGMHKTGSTAIQSAFNGYDNGRIRYASLGYENHSIPFYTAYSGDHQGYDIWKRAGLTHDAIDAKRLEMLAAIEKVLATAGSSDLVISGEDISAIPHVGIKQISKAFSEVGAKATVVIYVRRPISFMTSQIQQVIKSGLKPDRPQAPRYRLRLEKFYEEFGSENVVVRDFTRDALKNGDVVHDFAEILGVQDPPAPNSQNETMSTEATRISFLVNQLITPFGEPETVNRARQRLRLHVQSLFPGKFSIPEELVAGLVDDDDLEWLYEVSSIDFRRQDQLETPEFDAAAFQSYLNDPEPATLEALRKYLSKECGVPKPPQGKEFLIARYVMSFLGNDSPPGKSFGGSLFSKTRPGLRRAGHGTVKLPNPKAEGQHRWLAQGKQPDEMERDQTSPLVAFVHIPKTAGSFVNHLLKNTGKSGQDHIQNRMSDRAWAEKNLQKLEWLSGHVALPEMQEFLNNGTTRHSRFFSAVRDPVKQIASHYNWLIQIYHKGSAFYEAHPDRVKEISSAIRATDNSDADAVIQQILNARGLFLNQQARMLVGGDVARLSPGDVRNRLEAYSFVAHEGTLGQLLPEMFGRSIDLAAPVNKSPYHFDPEIFQTKKLKRFLEQHHASDFEIYDIVRSL